MHRTGRVALAACLTLAAPCTGRSEDDWARGVADYLRRSEYEFRPSSSGAWSAPNRAHDLRVHVSPGGVRVHSRTEPAPSWQLGMQLVGFGRGDRLAARGPVALVGSAERVELRSLSITEWYRNDPAGIEQGFDIPLSPPADESSALAPLVLEFHLSGNVVAFPDADARSLSFRTGDGTPVLRYAGLKVLDHYGDPLDAWLEASPEILRIVVDDSSAVYPLVVDPLMTDPTWSVTDPAADNLGVAVAAAGDVNGDGFGDVIVGDDEFDGGQPDEGRALVYLGSAAGLATTPAWSVEGDQAGALFGTSVAGAGDVDADGFDDVIVGAPDYDGDLMDEGRATVYPGSAAGPSSTPLWTKEGDDAFARFGRAVASAGDVNGDGYADLIVSAPYWPVTNRFGFVQSFLGSAQGPSTVSNWTRSSTQQGSQFGWSVASAGDIDGDGYDDVIVGAPRHQQGHADNGRAWTWHGGSLGLQVSPKWAFSACCGFNYFGHSVGAAGDVDGDGYADIVVGEPGSVSESGRVRVFRGGPLGPISNGHWSLTGAVPNARLGESVGTAGDVNGDGYADVVFGAPDLVQPGKSGGVWVHLGSVAGVSDDPYWERLGDFGQFGRSVGAAGDVDGDGFGEVLVGASNRALAFHGSADGPAVTSSWTVGGGQVGSGPGFSVSGAGDVDGDGYHDAIVGVPLYDGGLPGEGRALLFRGSPSGLETTPAWDVEGEQADARLGRSVSWAGDVDGDGFDDVVVGAPLYDGGESDEGRALVYLGSPAGLQTVAAWSTEGGQPGAQLGAAVARAGDVDGDGRAEVIVGAPRFDGPEPDGGRALVFLGGEGGPQDTAVWTFAGEQQDEHLGESVSGAGDVNGDGLADVIVGAPDYDDKQRSDAGRALVFHGSLDGPSSVPDWTADSGQAGARFGAAVSAGDVDGNGFADVVVGSPLFDSDQTDEGAVFAYLGSSAGLAASPGWTAERDSADARFGASVSAGGDVNGDGYSDPAVGSPGFSHPLNGGGLTLVYAGSATGPGTTPLGIQGPPGAQPGAGFGSAVAWAGDVNGDGFSDLLVAAENHDGGQIDEGGAFLFLGNGGDGVDRRPRQLRTDGSPLTTSSKSDSDSSFRLAVLARSAAGRRRVALEWEVKPLGVPFDGSGLGRSTPLDSGSPGPGGSAVELERLVDELAPRTGYRWRLRVTSDALPFPRGPWLTHAGNAASETDLWTAGCLDQDGDGFGFHGDAFCTGGTTVDCDDVDPDIWSAPGEVPNLRFPSGKTTLVWDPPAEPGGTAGPVYDTLRSPDPSDFSAATCVESDDGADEQATVTATPAPGTAFHYLVRAESACPGDGTGPLGATSAGPPRTGRACP